MCALRYFDGSSWPTNVAAVRDASVSLSRSMPVLTPMPCSIDTTSSVARLPDAPGAYGQPPSPPAAESIVVIPSVNAITQLASAVPWVSWKCTAIADDGYLASTRPSTSSTCAGFATPIVSLIEIWYTPISCSLPVSATTASGSTSPSYGHPNAVDRYARTGRPAARAGGTTSPNAVSVS